MNILITMVYRLKENTIMISFMIEREYNNDFFYEEQEMINVFIENPPLLALLPSSYTHLWQISLL